jgi:hypothetical protein
MAMSFLSSPVQAQAGSDSETSAAGVVVEKGTLPLSLQRLP